MPPRTEAELVHRREAARTAAQARASTAALLGLGALGVAAGALVVPYTVVAHVLAALAIVSLGAAAVVLAIRYRQLAAATRTLAEMADVDPDCGLPGQAALDRALADAIEVSQRTGRPLSLVMITVDQLRALHLERGIAAGRRLMLQAGVALASITAPHGGQAFRGPGSTLVALLPGASLAEAEKVADKATPALALLVRRNGGLVQLAAGAAVALAGDLPEDTLVRAERRCVKGRNAADDAAAVLRAVPPPT